MRPLGLTLFLLLTLPGQALAAESLAMGSALLRMVWALLIVVGVILILYALARKRIPFAQPGSGEIRIIETRHLVGRNTLVLVSVRDRTLLLGVSDERISLLCDQLDEQPGPKADTTDFDRILREQQ